MKFLKFFFLLLAIHGVAHAQLGNITASKAGNLYVMVGYHLDWFSKSDITLKGVYPDQPSIPEQARGKEYNFNLMGADAMDSAEVGDLSTWDKNIPQFAFRLGYMFYGENLNGIELSFDEVKYIVKPNQTLRVQGVVYDSLKQEVDSVDREMLVGENFIKYEHNNANYLMLSFVRGMYLWRTRTESQMLQFLVKPGLGIAIPVTNVSVNGFKKKNDPHVSGYLAGLEASLRYVAAEQFFVEIGGKACYANFSSVLNSDGSKASQTFTSIQALFSLGWMFRL